MATKTWSIDLVGVLADDEYVEEKTGYPNAIFVNSQNIVQFNIMLVSQTPDDFPKQTDLFSAYATDLELYGFEDDNHALREDRRQALRQFLQDHLVVFRPQRRILYQNNMEEVFQSREIRLIKKSDGFLEGQKLIPIPIFNKEKHGYSCEEFIQRLLYQKYLGKIEGFSTEPQDTPPFILWKDENGYQVAGDFQSHFHAHGGFSFQFKQLKIINFEDEWLEDSYSANDTLMFIGEITLKRIKASLQTAEEIQAISGIEKKQEAFHPIDKQEIAASISELEPLKIDEYDKEEEETYKNPEERFLEHLLELAKEQGLQYRDKDLYNFHTALKSNTLNILAGMSGTGKSKLVQLYAKALGLTGNQFVMIPVRPFWTDDADLIGFMDSMNNVYRAGDSGLLNTLIEAEKNPKKLYLICFDEMNLARVEHYFSQFLSVLEIDDSSRRVLKLYNEEFESRLYNSHLYPPKVRIGENILFVGTVNLDESTYHFSDKVLDRSNVITLGVMPYEGLKEILAFRDNKEKRKAPYDNPLGMTYDEFIRFKSQNSSFQLSERESEFLWKVHLSLQEISTNMGLGPRVIRRINDYIKNLPDSPILTREEAFDLQFVQRVMTKVRGPEGILSPLLGKFDLNGEINGGKLYELIEEYQEIFSFTQTKRVLYQKTKELRINGYTF